MNYKVLKFKILYIDLNVVFLFYIFFCIFVIVGKIDIVFVGKEYFGILV